MRIAMIGGGYVGLVSSACFAEFGIDVTVVETDAEKLAALHEGRMPIHEPGLDKLVAENVAAGRLRFPAHPGGASRKSAGPPALVSTSTWPPILNSCARAMRSATSCDRTAW